MPPTVEDALLHWLHLFDAAKEVESLDELSDGRIIAAVFSELHPGSAIEAGLLSSSYNWMLKQNNIDKVLQELMGVYQKRCQVPPERMPLTSMVNSAAIAKEASRADLVLVLRVLATSILASPALDRIGGAIMEMNQNNRTEGCPDVIMGLMQETQEEFGIENPPGDQDLDVSGEQDDYFVDPHFGDGPELHAYDGAPTAADSQAQRSHMYGNAAALEERIAALEKEKHELEQQRDEASQERDEARKLLSERDTWLADALDRQLQHASAPPRPEPRDDGRVERLLAELSQRDETIRGLQISLQKKASVESYMQQLQDEVDVANDKIPELEGEVDRLKRQRDAAQGKLQEQKRLRAALESTVDAARDEARELERKLERECARAAESDSLLQDKLVTETQNADLQRRLTHAEQQLEPVLTQVQHARAASISDWLQERARWEQRLQREKADLERQLEEAQEAAQEHPAAPAAPSLADELQGLAGGAGPKDDGKQLRAQLDDAEERLRDAQREAAAAAKQVEARHRGEMQALEERLAAANQSVERLQAKATELEQERDKAEAESAAARADLRKLEGQTRELQSERESEADRGKEDRAALEHQLKMSKEEAAKMKEQRAAAEEEHAAQLQKKAEEMAELQRGLDAAEARAREHLHELQQEQAKSARADAAAADSKEQEAKHEEKALRVAELAQENEVLRGELDNLRRQVEQAHRDRPQTERASGTEVALRRERDEALARVAELEKRAPQGEGTDWKQKHDQARERLGKFQKQYEAAKKQSQRELRLVSSAFYDMGISCMHQQLGMLGDNSQPQSWLAKKKFEAHDFSKMAYRE
eukprot:TRINITY_DN1220_c0_g1_i2.p1 TRINITY_DN1220_c0_g1~~TRINITY_DN1220_c0_g1_i2.p1  ORF type:complete len:865 (+),score=399.80 TRINITY_DN1220_c0_g1_i2:113-2596(+)